MDRELVPRAGSMRLDDGRLGRAGRRICFLRLPSGGGGGGHENVPLTRGLHGADPEWTNGQGGDAPPEPPPPASNSEELAAGEAAAEAVAAAKAAEEAAAAADAAVQCRQLEVMALAKSQKIVNLKAFLRAGKPRRFCSPRKRFCALAAIG